MTVKYTFCYTDSYHFPNGLPNMLHFVILLIDYLSENRLNNQITTNICHFKKASKVYGTYLGQWNGSSKINNKIRLQIPHSNLIRIHNKVTATNNPRIRSNKSRPKLHNHMKNIKQIRKRSKKGYDDA